MEWNHWIALALAAAGLWAGWIRVQRSKKIRAMSGWSQVPGRVVAHDIEETSSTDTENRTDYHYDPKLTYEYVVSGRSFTGTRLSLDGVSFGSRKKAQKYLDERPVGSEVPVYVNPADPQEAVLTVKAGGDWWVPIFFFVLAAAVGLGFLG